MTAGLLDDDVGNSAAPVFPNRGGLGEQRLVRVHQVSPPWIVGVQDGAVGVEHVGGEQMPRGAGERIGPGRVGQHALGGQGGGQRCSPPSPVDGCDGVQGLLLGQLVGDGRGDR